MADQTSAQLYSNPANRFYTSIMTLMIAKTIIEVQLPSFSQLGHLAFWVLYYIPNIG